MTAEPIPSGVDPALEAHWGEVFEQRTDLLDRINHGDAVALGELFEALLPGAKAGPVTYHRPGA